MRLPPEERDVNFLRDHRRTSQVVPEVALCLPARNVVNLSVVDLVP